MQFIKWMMLTTLLSTPLTAEIVEISQLNEIENFIFEIDSALTNSDWILFDIDYTLVEPDHPALQMAVIKQNKYRFFGEWAKFTDDEKILLPLILVTHVPGKLTEIGAADLVMRLQACGATVLGFTAANTSVLPEIGPFPEWRTKELIRLGIDFKKGLESAAVPKGKIEFSEFAPLLGSYPLYHEGILYSNVIPSKGDVLEAFLNITAQQPKRVIFVEDTLENLHSVEAMLKSRGISFLGIHYKIPGDEGDLMQISDHEWERLWKGIRERLRGCLEFMRAAT